MVRNPRPRPKRRRNRARPYLVDKCRKCRRNRKFYEGRGGEWACGKCGWVDPNDW